MGQSAEELRREIEQTRAGLGDTLDAIGDRVSPGRIMERKKNRLSAGVRSVRERVMGTATHGGQALAGTAQSARQSVSDTAGSAVDSVREAPQMMLQRTEGSPLAAGAIAFGVGFLAAALIPPSEKEQEAASQLMDKAQPLKESVTEAAKDVAEHLKEPAKEAAEQVKSAASDSAQTVTDTAKGAAQQSTQQAKDAAQSVKSEATGNTPLQ